MNRDDLVAFGRRDWAAIERQKARYWAERKKRMSPTEVLALSDELRRHVLMVQPGWPDEMERDADRATHLRVAEALRATSPD